ncbi:3-carboxyethylcatechol 2,3-dioxygenase [Paenarthrobacter sp. 2TAF44]|uniref:3-carboxyethylcatechol 2,3-dioxygenase n=1 Tax=Paenarthrobacter sp. 2TAF44 TaxID=3233018 RepID=UPI003F989F37
MTVALLAMSHSPLLEYGDPGPDIKAEVEAAVDAARSFVHDYDPDLVINLGPDHYNGFFYQLMPPFCIGYDAVSIGDFGSQAGPLNVPKDVAEGLAEFVIDRGIDIAISLKMEVDHGAVQPMELIYGDISSKPFVPVFINSVAPPFTPLKRVRQLGEAIGGYLKTLDRKVLLIASGGLSHDPPVPRLATASEAQRRMLIGADGRQTPEARAARQQRIFDAAEAFARGEANIKDLAPEWDRQLMKILASGDLSPIDAWDPHEMTEIAGNSSHEVRTWIAAYAALGAIGPYTVNYSYYRPIREYIAGFGITTATLDN